MILDSNLSWNEYIKALCKKVGVLRKLSYLVPKYILKNIYCSFIHPHIIYGIIAYGTACYTRLKAVQIIQNKCIKAICKLPILFPTLLLYEVESKGILPIGALYDFQVALFMYKSIKIKSIVSNLEFNITNHNHNTRFNKNISCGCIKSEFGRKSMSFAGPSIYNKLPESIKTNSLNVYHFKINLRDFFKTFIKDYF